MNRDGIIKLSKISWTNALSIGNANIDKDHKRLLDIYNDLVDLEELERDREEFARILSQMTDYARSHFKKEEAYMQEFNYSDLIEHQYYHAKYIRKVATYNVDLLSKNPPVQTDVLEFIGKWWKVHILKEDAKYENYKQQIQSSVIYIPY